MQIKRTKKALNRIKFAMWYLINKPTKFKTLKKAWHKREGKKNENKNGLQLNAMYDDDDNLNKF